MSPLVVLFLFVFVDVLGFSLVLPLLPFLTDEFQMSPLFVGAIQSSNAIAQLIAVPVIGSLSDRYGRQPLLLLCVLGTLLSFVIFAVAWSPWVILLSRILDGFLGGNISLANACIADLTTPENRASGMGIVGAAFGLGFIVGPAIGGILAQNYGWWVPPWVAAGLSFLNMITIMRMEEPLPPSKRKSILLGSAVSAEISGICKCIADPVVGPLLWRRFVFSLTFTIFEQSFGFFTRDVFQLKARSSACCLSLFALVYAMVQGTGIRRLTAHLSQTSLLSATFVVSALAFMTTFFIHNTVQLFALLAVLGCSTGISNTITNAAVSMRVDSYSQGRTLGVSASLGSLSRILGPLMTGFLVQGYGSKYPYLLCALLSACMCKVNSKQKDV